MYEILIEEPKVNLFTWEYHVDGLMRKEFKDCCGERLKESLLEFENDYGKWSADIENFDTLSKAVFKAVKAGKPSSKELKQKTLETGARTLALCDEILARDLTKASEQELLDLVNELRRLSIDLMFYGVFAVYSDHHNFLLSKELDAVIRRRAKEKRLQKNPQEYWSVLTAFTEETIARRENIELFKIAAEINDLPNARARTLRTRANSANSCQKIFLKPCRKSARTRASTAGSPTVTTGPRRAKMISCARWSMPSRPVVTSTRNSGN